MFAFLVLSKIDIGVGMEVVGTPSKFISYVEDADKKYSIGENKKRRYD
jgi:hypothetical protein